MKTCAGLVLLVGLQVPVDATDDATKKDLEKIQGTWNAVAGEKDGERAPKNAVADVRFTFKGNQLIIGEGKGKIEGKFKLDAGKKPKAIDITMTQAGKVQKTVAGIYQLQGDELKIIVMRGGNERPKEFKTTKGSRLEMLTFRRGKK